MDKGHGFRTLTERLARKVEHGLGEKAIRRFKLPREAVRNIRSFLKLSGPVPGGFPTELLPLAASMWSGYFLTPFAQQQMEGWVLPYWLRMQTLPSSGSFVPHGHVFLKSNMTHRNWTGVGLPGFPYEGTVDPRGLITPWPFAPSIDFWLLREGEIACPSMIDNVRQSLVDDLPMVRTEFDALGFSCTLTTFVAPLDGMPLIMSVAEAQNRGDSPATVGLVVSARPYNTESIRAINRIAFDPDRRIFIVDGDPLAYLPEKPDHLILSDYTHGDVALLLVDPARKRPPEGSLEVEEPVGLATAAVVFDREIPPEGSEKLCFACPLMAGVWPDFDRMLSPTVAVSTALGGLDESRRIWRELVSSGMRARIPEDRYQKAFDVNKTFLLLMYDGQSITPGVSTYHMMWFRDAAYMVPALERAGYTDMAKRILLTYPDRQSTDGFFRSHNGEWDSCGQAIWTLVNHYLMTGDRDFLADVYAPIMKGARWIDSMRSKDLPEGDPAHGLLPPGISAEHFGINDRYYWDDIWSAGGLKAGARAARDLGFGLDAAYMERVADELMQDMEASWDQARSRLGKKVIPIAPARDVDAASIGILAAVYPLDLLPVSDESVENTVEEIMRKCFYSGTHFHGIMHCGINPYLSMHVAQYFLKRRDRRAHDIFESLWSMATDTYTYPEAINPLTGGGAYGDGHDGWCAADVFNFLRNLLVLEDGNRLVLLALGKREWFADGCRIEIENAPTRFGPISYSVESGTGSVTYSLPGGFERPPESIELGVPFVVTSFRVDGKKDNAPDRGGAIVVPSNASEVVIKIRRDQDPVEK